MNKSEQINELAAALAKAQAEIVPPKKDKTAALGKYSYKYADLSGVLDAIRGPLSKHGLCVTQLLYGKTLTTALIHSSGQWIESRYDLGEYERAQDLGSAITYLRRYCLSALICIASDDDDDGAAAVQVKKPAEPKWNKETLTALLSERKWPTASFMEMVRAHFKADRLGALTPMQLAEAVEIVKSQTVEQATAAGLLFSSEPDVDMPEPGTNG